MIDISYDWDVRYTYADIRNDGKRVGTIEIWPDGTGPNNTSHEFQLRSFLTEYDPAISAELFARMEQTLQRPMVATVDSCSPETHDFFLAGGFYLLSGETIFTMEVQQEDYLGCWQPAVTLYQIDPGSTAYISFRDLLMGDAITPPGSRPLTIIAQIRDGQPLHMASIDDNRIGHLYSSDPATFPIFLDNLLRWMFREHETLCFTASERNWCSMVLKALFSGHPKVLRTCSYYRPVSQEYPDSSRPRGLPGGPFPM